MTVLLKAVSFAVLLSQLQSASAATCRNEASDETSLIQKKQILKPGTERKKDMPDAPQGMTPEEQDAYEEGLHPRDADGNKVQGFDKIMDEYEDSLDVVNKYNDALDEASVRDEDVDLEAGGSESESMNEDEYEDRDDDRRNRDDDNVVTKAFTSASGKTRDRIKQATANKIDAANRADEAQLASSVNGRESVENEMRRAYSAQARANRRVAEMQRNVAATTIAAQQRIQNAKGDQEAVRATRGQVEAAAMLGRQVGAALGRDKANFAVAGWKVHTALQNAQARRTMMDMQVAKRRALAAAGVNYQTQMMAAGANMQALGAHRMATLAQSRANARGALMRNRIAGPDGLDNTLAERNAKWAELSYKAMGKWEQDRTDLAAKGEWPLGNWPAGP